MKQPRGKTKIKKPPNRKLGSKNSEPPSPEVKTLSLSLSLSLSPLKQLKPQKITEKMVHLRN
jgi:hypothetical protein